MQCLLRWSIKKNCQHLTNSQSFEKANEFGKIAPKVPCEDACLYPSLQLTKFGFKWNSKSGKEFSSKLSKLLKGRRNNSRNCPAIIFVHSKFFKWQMMDSLKSQFMPKRRTLHVNWNQWTTRQMAARLEKAFQNELKLDQLSPLCSERDVNHSNENPS